MIACAIASDCIAQSAKAYEIVQRQSTLNWTGYYLFSFGEHSGTIDILNGTFFYDGKQGLSGSITADMRTIRDTDMPYDDGGKDLSEHLMSKDFFDVEAFPQAKIEIVKSEAVEDGRPGDPNLKIIANLTIKKITAPVTLYALVSTTGNTLTVMGKFKFDRTRWGVEYNSGKVFSEVGDGAISDAIALAFNLTAVSK